VASARPRELGTSRRASSQAYRAVPVFRHGSARRRPAGSFTCGSACATARRCSRLECVWADGGGGNNTGAAGRAAPTADCA